MTLFSLYMSSCQEIWEDCWIFSHGDKSHCQICRLEKVRPILKSLVGRSERGASQEMDIMSIFETLCDYDVCGVLACTFPDSWFHGVYSYSLASLWFSNQEGTTS